MSCEYFVYNLTFRRSWKSSTYRVMFGICLNKAIVVEITNSLVCVFSFDLRVCSNQRQETKDDTSGGK